MKLSHLFLAAVACIASFARPAGAQDAPKRPRLSSSADTNDARAYFSAGLAVLERDPKRAESAFYWAAKLDPTNAEALYARRVAILLEDNDRLKGYWSGDTTNIPWRLKLDSLSLSAFRIDPFLYQKLDNAVFDRVIRIGASRLRLPEGVSVADAIDAVRASAEYGPADIAAWNAYLSGDFHEALRLYHILADSAQFSQGYHAARGKIFYQLGQFDSAAVAFKAAIAAKANEKAQSLAVNTSKSLLYYSYGLVSMQLGDVDNAKSAFNRASAEDPYFGRPHFQLGLLQIAAGDTAGGVANLNTSARLEGTDAGLYYLVGFITATMGKIAEAEPSLRKAASLDQYYAHPHAILGEILEANAKLKEALAEYETYLRLAARNDPRRDEIEERVAMMKNIVH